jgi:hypothetical protein
VAVKQNGLKGEYFFIGGTRTSMPDFTGLTPNLVGSLARAGAGASPQRREVPGGGRRRRAHLRPHAAGRDVLLGPQ